MRLPGAYYVCVRCYKVVFTDMAFYEDEEKEKEAGTVSEDALGEVLGVDEDADDEDTPIVPPVEEDEKWE